MVSSLGNTGIPEHAATAFRAEVSEAIPKSLTHRLRVSLKRLAKPVWLVCREGLIEFLLGELALHRLEMVLADRPMPAGLAVRAHSCKLGESALAFFASPGSCGRTWPSLPARTEPRCCYPDRTRRYVAKSTAGWARRV